MLFIQISLCQIKYQPGLVFQKRQESVRTILAVEGLKFLENDKIFGRGKQGKIKLLKNEEIMQFWNMSKMYFRDCSNFRKMFAIYILDSMFDAYSLNLN